VLPNCLKRHQTGTCNCNETRKTASLGWCAVRCRQVSINRCGIWEQIINGFSGSKHASRRHCVVYSPRLVSITDIPAYFRCVTLNALHSAGYSIWLQSGLQGFDPRHRFFGRCFQTGPGAHKQPPIPYSSRGQTVRFADATRLRVWSKTKE
jgi:hypothetical protein